MYELAEYWHWDHRPHSGSQKSTISNREKHCTLVRSSLVFMHYVALANLKWMHACLVRRVFPFSFRCCLFSQIIINRKKASILTQEKPDFQEWTNALPFSNSVQLSEWRHAGNSGQGCILSLLLKEDVVLLQKPGVGKVPRVGLCLAGEEGVLWNVHCNVLWWWYNEWGTCWEKKQNKQKTDEFVTLVLR